MKESRIRKVASIALTLTFCLGAFSPVFAQNGLSLEGTWTTVVTPINCQTGTAVAPLLPGNTHICKRRNIVRDFINSTPGFWRLGSNQGLGRAGFAFINFRFNPAGALIGSQIVRQDAVLFTVNSFTSTGTVQFLDLNGNVVGTGCASSLGRRFQ